MQKTTFGGDMVEIYFFTSDFNSTEITVVANIAKMRKNIWQSVTVWLPSLNVRKSAAPESLLALKRRTWLKFYHQRLLHKRLLLEGKKMRKSDIGFDQFKAEWNDGLDGYVITFNDGRVAQTQINIETNKLHADYGREYSSDILTTMTN
jgi:hypothetical protein